MTKENLDYKPSYISTDNDYLGRQITSGVNELFSLRGSKNGDKDKNNMVLRGLVRLVSGKILDIYPAITKDPNDIVGNLFESLKEKYSKNILKVHKVDGVDFPVFDYKRKIVTTGNLPEGAEPRVKTYESLVTWSKLVFDNQPFLWQESTPKEEREWEAARDVQSIAFISRIVFNETTKSAEVRGLPPLMVPQVYWKI